MKTIAVFLIGIVVGMLAGTWISFIAKSAKRRKKKKVGLNTYAKVITTAVVVHGMILTSCSYLLSAFGLESVADVSSTIVQEIIAPVVVYLATNMIMNIFEKNKLSFSVPLNSAVITKDGERVESSGSDEAAG